MNNVVKIEKNIELSVIIPVYNDASALSVFLPELLRWLASSVASSEVVLVDDGSKDHIEELYHEMVDVIAPQTALSLLRFSRNFGKEVALSAGLEAVKGEAVVMMDADGQHSIETLEKMLALYQKGVDVVAGVQEYRHQESFLSRFFKKGFYALIQDSQRYEIKPNAGDFRLMSRKVVDALLSLPERQRFMKGLYAWVGFNTVYLPYIAQERAEGESKFNYKGLFELALIGLTSFSQKPLRWIMRIGMIISLLAFAYGAYIVLDVLFFGKDTAGWATLAAGLMFSTGVQLISIGIIGEHVGRIYEETKQRPLYILDKQFHSKTLTDVEIQSKSAINNDE